MAKGGGGMTATKTFDGARVNIRYHPLSVNAIRAMRTERLREHIGYIDRQLRLWYQDMEDEPAWVQEAARKWRAALNCEKRRIMMTLGERADQRSGDEGAR
jgi:hypothetical protein